MQTKKTQKLLEKKKYFMQKKIYALKPSELPSAALFFIKPINKSSLFYFRIHGVDV